MVLVGGVGWVLRLRRKASIWRSSVSERFSLASSVWPAGAAGAVL
jgi:hypothetical protein